jgi:hypothetical protein
LISTKGQQRAEDQFPHTLHPEMHHPPPVKLVAHDVRRIVEGEQEEYREAPEPDQKHGIDRGLAALEDGHADVEQEREGDHDDADLGDQRLFEEFATHCRQQVVTGELRQGGVGHRQVTHHRQTGGNKENPEQRDGQLGAVEFSLGLLGHQIVGGPHEAHQQPDDQRIGVHHARNVERDFRKQEIAHHILQAHDQAKQDLGDEQCQCAHEIGLGNRLGCVFHLSSPIGSRCQP